MPQAALEHVILTAALLLLCFSFFWVSTTMMQSLVHYGMQVKLTNLGNFLAYHIVSVYALVNTSNTALTLNKTVTLPQTLDDNIVYAFTVTRSGGFSVIELYTVSSLYSFNIPLPRIQAIVTLPQSIVIGNVGPIVTLGHSNIVIEVSRNSAGVTSANLI